MDCSAVKRKVPRSQQCSGVTVWETAAVSRTNTYTHGCSDTQRYECLFLWHYWIFTPFLIDCLLLADVRLSAQNALPFKGRDCLTGCSSMTGSWAELVTVAGRVTTCVLPVISCHSHVKGLFLCCCSALVANTGVKCTDWVGANKRAFSDHSGQFTYFVHYIFLIHCQEPILPLWSQQQFLHTACRLAPKDYGTCTLWFDVLAPMCQWICQLHHLTSTLQKETRVSIKWWNVLQNTKTLKSSFKKSQLP